MRASASSTLLSKAEILILTPILVEYEAVAELLTSAVSISDREFECNYLAGYLKGNINGYRIALRLAGSGQLNISEAVHQGMRFIRPQVIIMFGTAGGIKKLRIGDIIVGTAGYSYESGRVVDGGFYSNPRALETSKRLVEAARTLGRKTLQWHSYLPSNLEVLPALKFGPIASGDKVITTLDTPIVQQIKERLADALGLEMEAFAFLKASSSYPQVETFILRGVSDLLAGKEHANMQGSKQLSTGNAAAFLRYFLEWDDLAVIVDKGIRWNRKYLYLLLILLTIPTLFLLNGSNATNGYPASSEIALHDQDYPDSSAREPNLYQPRTQLDTLQKQKQIHQLDKPKVKNEDIHLELVSPEKGTEGIPILKDTITSLSLDTVGVTIRNIELPIVDYKIYLYNKEGRQIKGADFYVNKMALNRIGNTVQMHPGNYELRIEYGEHFIIKNITVPDEDNGQIKIVWNPE
jgi:nucleoside phosphorylase